MNDEYSDVFKAIVPEAPSSESWAGGARRKRRNRGRAMAGVAAAAIIALIVPVALTVGSNAALIATPGESTSPSPQVVTPSPDPATDAPGAAACWDAPGQLRHATLQGATDGAVRAWLCGDAGVPITSLGTVGPLEPLVVGVDDLVDFIQAQPELGVDVACTAEYRLTYNIVLDYRDGSRHVVPGGLHGCGAISDGETTRTGAQGLYDLALDLWRTQRDTLVAPDDVDAVANCPASMSTADAPLPSAQLSMLPFDPAEAVTGFICTEVANEDGTSGHGNMLNDDLVAQIAASIRSDSSEVPVYEHELSWLTLTGAWGDQLTLQRTPGDMFKWFDGDTPMFWKPSADVLAELEAALEAPPDSTPSPSPSAPAIEPTLPVPDLPPKRLASEGCADANSGKNISSKLPDGKLPDGPSKIWFCSGQGQQDVVGPLEPLGSPSLVAEAVASYNTSSKTDYNRACLDVAGPDYIIVHDYPDGTRYAITVQIAGCDGLSDGQTVRGGGRAYVDQLVMLWQEQRSTSPPSQTRPGPLCPQLESLFPIAPLATTFVSGHACIDWGLSSDGVLGQAREVPLSPELVATLPAQLATAVPDLPEGRPQYGGLVLLTAQGDPFSLLQGPNGSFYWRDGKSLRFWTPTGKMADELKTIFGT